MHLCAGYGSRSARHTRGMIRRSCGPSIVFVPYRIRADTILSTVSFMRRITLSPLSPSCGSSSVRRPCKPAPRAPWRRLHVIHPRAGCCEARSFHALYGGRLHSPVQFSSLPTSTGFVKRARRSVQSTHSRCARARITLSSVCAQHAWQMPLDQSLPCLVAFTIFESCLRAYVVPARFGSMPSAVLLFPSVRARARQTCVASLATGGGRADRRCSGWTSRHGTASSATTLTARCCSFRSRVPKSSGERCCERAASAAASMARWFDF